MTLLDSSNADSHLKVFLEKLFDLNISIYLSKNQGSISLTHSQVGLIACTTIAPVGTHTGRHRTLSSGPASLCTCAGGYLVPSKHTTMQIERAEDE
jgi:hypothetical protein